MPAVTLGRRPTAAKTMTFAAHSRAARGRYGIACALGMAAMCCACPAPAAEASASADATIIAPPGIAAVEPTLRFGTFAAAAAGQAVTIHTNGGRTMRGVLPGGVDRARGFGPASLVVTGERGWMYSIALPASCVVTSSSGPHAPDTLRVTDLQIAPAEDERLADGGQRLLLGATVILRGGQPAGHYSGNVTVSVSYD